MKTPDEAKQLARAMVDIGRKNGRAVSALITNMDVPLGYAIGNILEVREAIDTLRGRGPLDLTEICLSLVSEMAHLSLGLDRKTARATAESALRSGAAYEKFKEWISAHGADVAYAEMPEKYATSTYSAQLFAEDDGYIFSMDTERIGLVSSALGAGRASKDDKIDYTAGIVFSRKTGDAVKRGDTVSTLYTSNEGSLNVALTELASAISISKENPKKHPLIVDQIF